MLYISHFTQSRSYKQSIKFCPVLVDQKRTVRHKKKYFRLGAAQGDEAKPDSLRLMPEGELARFLEDDWKKMDVMFPGSLPWSFRETAIRFTKNRVTRIRGMGLMFTGSFDELATRLSPLDGEWDDTPEDQKVFRLRGGIIGDFEPVNPVV